MEFYDIFSYGPLSGSEITFERDFKIYCLYSFGLDFFEKATESEIAEMRAIFREIVDAERTLYNLRTDEIMDSVGVYENARGELFYKAAYLDPKRFGHPQLTSEQAEAILPVDPGSERSEATASEMIEKAELKSLEVTPLEKLYVDRFLF